MNAEATGSNPIAAGMVEQGEQGWCSGESAHLPPVWPEFESGSRCHMWVEFAVGVRPCFKGFSLGSPCFPPSTKTGGSSSKL